MATETQNNVVSILHYAATSVLILRDPSSELNYMTVCMTMCRVSVAYATECYATMC